MSAPHLLLPGSATNYPSVPSTAALNLVGTNFTIDVDAALTTTRPAAYIQLVTKDDVSGNGRSWGLKLAGGGMLEFATFDEAGALLGVVAATTAVTSATDTRYNYRVVYDATDYKFYERLVGGSYTLLDTIAKGTMVLANTDSPTDVWMLGRADGVYEAGELYDVTIWSDATQTTTLRAIDFTNLTTAEVDAASFTEGSANAATVTLNGTAWTYLWDTSPLLTMGVG